MQQVEGLIEQLREKVKGYFSNDATGHNIDHLERTLNYAMFLQKKEGGDEKVVAVAAFIHDIHRIMSAEQNRFVSPKESLPVASKFLKGLDLDEKQKAHILHAIEHHEEYSFGKGGVQVEDIESKILQDADNLDCLGAVAIARVLMYGVAHNQPVYAPEVPLYRNEYDEANDDASSIHHIYNKLLRLADNMNTKSAKDLAKEKHAFMEKFMDMYIAEATGKLE